MSNEILDVVNENDEIIGQATRDECHANPELLHRAVHFTLYDPKTRRILLTQRAFTKKHDGGKYCVLGEHLQSGETYEMALRRGVSEKLGIVFDKFTELGVNKFAYQQEREIAKFYLCEWTGQEISIDKKEAEKVLWISSEELKTAKLDVSEITKYWLDRIDLSSLQ